MKPIIAIMPNSDYMISDSSFDDIYHYRNNFVKKVVENGGIPYFIPLCNDEIVYDLLDMCDGLLLPGGENILPASLEVVDYFYKNKKPILGICLGMQTLACYSVGVDKKNEEDVIEKIGNDSHRVTVKRNNEGIIVHKNLIEKNSKLFNILNKEEIDVNSIHRYKVKKVGNEFIVNMFSFDGIIEGIECKDKNHFVLGVQFHPELLEQYNVIFERFIYECVNKDI